MFPSNIKKAYLFKFLVQFHLIGGVLVPFFLDWGGINFTQILLLQSWYLIWALVLEAPTGLVADLIGRKQSLYLAGLIGALAVLVYSSVANMWIFLAGEFLFAASTAFYSGADEAFLYDSLKSEGKEGQIGKIISKFESVGLVALMISAPIGSLIASQFGPRISLMLMAIPMILAFFVGLTFKEPSNVVSKEASRIINIIKKGAEIIKGRRKIQWIAIDLGIVHSLSFLMIWLYQPLLMQFSVNIAWFGLVSAANTGAQIVIMNSYHRIEKKIGGIDRLLQITALLPGILFLIAGSIKILPIAVLAIIFSLGFGLTRRPLVSEELNQMIPSAQRATVLSALLIFRRLFSAGLNPIVGRLADWSLNNTFVILGVALLSFSLFRYLILFKYSKVSKVNQ